ncbi:unnamed protein product [Angiostrongylus costaricensis]|uniref:C2H2-type domain-containing protein n=1 Tax=Angiostrongylus costaricensis TaxID=334426 RepID=A0A0R3PUC2_ANGCS|nr:unnamed protein product [Angiostrongylus costaricensis]
MRKINIDCTAPSSWFPKKTVSSDTASLDDLDCTRCGSTQDPSLSSINASSWYPSHTSALPPIPSPNPNRSFGLSSITGGTNIDTGSLINAGSPLGDEDSEEPKKCEVNGCSRAFSLEANLKSHLKTHTGEKPHKCQFCDRAFSHPYNLRVHISRRHKDKKLG